MSKNRVIVIGAGPAGLMAAGQAAAAGADTILLEKMAGPGRKLSITGKGRCNITNVADKPDFMKHFGRTSRLLGPAFDFFFTPDLVTFIQETLDVPLITERGGRVFPASGRAPDITRALVHWAQEQGVRIHTNSSVKHILTRNGRVEGVLCRNEEISCDALILAMGGTSYPKTGSTGDGYRIAERAGHRITDIRPALVPLETAGKTAPMLSGLELRNAGAALYIDGTRTAEAFGELSFTDYGVSGPIILTLSGQAVKALLKGKNTLLSIDLKPALTQEKLAGRIDREFKKRRDQDFGSLLRSLIPRELLPVCCAELGVPEKKVVGKITADTQTKLAAWLKNFQLKITAHRPMDEAIITAGGIDTAEINPHTMESRIIKNMYFAGEIMDIQADTGGYNLQAAFSTGWLAGRCAAGSKPVPTRETTAAKPASQQDNQQIPKSRQAFLPTTVEEVTARGWDALDVIIITGDSYIDSPFIGAAVIGRILEKEGYRVGIIAQPDVDSPTDITRLGEPKLFWGVTAGCIDSMVANRTASGKRRRNDDYTPGGLNNRRPDRASLIYCNLIRKHFKNTVPLVLGGIEASLRRIAHYDFWSDKIRRSILFDAKADYLLYGMADKSVLELAACLTRNEDPSAIRGLCYMAREKPSDAVELAAYSKVAADRDSFTDMFHQFYRNNDPITASTLAQLQDTRFLVQNPPAPYLSGEELDAVHNMNYERDQHPYYAQKGAVKALETIRFSITTHRGCYGECNFCAIAVHQGRTIRSRSPESILTEAKALAAHPEFKGRINDLGGPTANMYGFDCARKKTKGCCIDKRCIFPDVCGSLKVDHKPQIELLRQIRAVKGVRQVVVASGLRHDLVLADTENGEIYLKELVSHHVSGQMKLAPEHSCHDVLKLMGKPDPDSLLKFRSMFYRLTKQAGKDQYLTYYMIAAHPGCTMKDMAALKEFAVTELQLRPEQVQVFTPTPSTYSTLMYWTGKDPFTGKTCYVEKTGRGREQQKFALTAGTHR